MDPRNRQRLPGNRIVRRRIGATQVIPVPAGLKRQAAPNVQTHAKRFVIAFAVIVLIGAGLLSLPIAVEKGMSTTPVDALFTAMSASAVTGLVVVDTQDHWSFFGELVILVLIQIGGLGFMVGASLVLVSLGRGSSLRDALLLQDGSPTLSLQEAVDLSKRILRFVFICEAIGAILLTIRFMRDESPLVALWYGIFHAVSMFCNAGFDLEGGFRSMSGYQTSPWINFTIIGLIQAGGLSYMVLSDTWNKRSWNRIAFNTKLVLLLNALLIVIGTVLFLITEWRSALADTPEWAKPMVAIFQSVSARTAGVSSIDFAHAHTSTVFLWIGVMLVGGASGSTAGGVKLATAAVVVIAVVSTLRGQSEAQAFGRRVSTTQVFRSMAIIAVFVSMHFAFTLMLAFTEDVAGNSDPSFLSMMFETMSAAATVGLSTGITPHLSDPGKLVLCAAMFFGRLGPLTLVYALTERQRVSRYRFPEAPIPMG
ncbi:MAG: TrkH family potassium uptake protein [Thermomicrobiales bacterium]